MKTVSMDVDLSGLELDENTKRMGNRDIVKSVVLNLIQAYSNEKRGLSFQEQRLFSKIADALDNPQNVEAIELEDEQYRFLKAVMKEAKLPPARLFSRVFDLIEKADK